MFKLKPGNVFQKINKMDRKQAYTIGAIVLVCFVALLTLASFLGNADDSSFEDYNTRGYDLAQMPFLNDEAEEYLLASKYPDMQGNNSTMLYSAEEEKERQEEDAAAAEEAGEEDTASLAGESAGASGGYSGYGGYRGGGRTAAPTQVGKLGSASMGTASGSGVNATWGSPGGDFSPYKSQEKGSETPVQFKNQDARRALSQFSQGSRAAAGFRDSKSANAKKALMGGYVQGSEAFTDKGVDLSKTGGLAIDPNAPVSSADLSNLDDKVAEAAKDAKDKKEEFEKGDGLSWLEKLGQQLVSGLVDKVIEAGGNALEQQMGTWMANMNANSAFHKEINKYVNGLYSTPLGELTPEDIQVLQQTRGTDSKGTKLDWASLQQQAKEGKISGSVGERWIAAGEGEQAPKNASKRFLTGNENDTNIADYVETMDNHSATIRGTEAYDAERTLQMGRSNGNFISRALKKQPKAPDGSSSDSYSTVEAIKKSGKTPTEQVQMLQDNLKISKEAAELEVYGSAR